MVEDYMTKKLITCDIDDNILFVSNLMKTNDVGFILIMNNNKLYGIITDRDIVCDLILEQKTIKDFAHTNIIKIDKNNTIKSALELMKKNKIKRLIVTDKNKIAGVLSLSDIYNTNISSDEIKEALKTIFAINKNNEKDNDNIHEFIL